MKARFRVFAAIGVLGLLAPLGCVPAGPPGPAGSTAQVSEALPAAADGIAFIRDGAAFVVDGGSAREVAADRAQKVAVGYSADRTSLLVTEERGANRAVVMVPTGVDATGSIVVLDVSDSALGSVRAVSASGRLYYSIFGDPANLLLVSAPNARSKPTTVALSGSFSAEFDVDASGTIVYTGSGQNPASVTIKTKAAERPLVAGLTTAFTPAFAADGRHVCLTGSEHAGGPISVWVVDRGGGTPRSLGGTDVLHPTFPVFSPDGGSIAFRSADDGTIWVAPVDGGKPHKAISASDEAPIGW